MIKEAYVSYEIAKLLKEKGFNEPCTSYFWSEENGADIDYSDIPFTNKQLYSEQTLRSTHQMACAWLREEKNIVIVIEPHAYDYPNEKTSSYVFAIWEGDNYIEIYSNSKLHGISYLTYEEAVEAALKYCLKNLI